MTTPAIGNLSFADGYVIFQQIFELLQDHEQKRLFNLSPRRMLVSIFYANELVFPTPVSEIREVFLTTRKFLKNDGAGTLTVVGDFVPWDFESGIVHCCSNLELGYFLGKARQLGLPLVEDTYEAWLDQGPPPQSFFWS